MRMQPESGFDVPFLAEEGLEHMADCVRESHLDNDSIAWAEDDDFEDFDVPMAVGKRLRAGLRLWQRANKRLAEEQQDAQREATAAKITRALTAHFGVRLDRLPEPLAM